MNIGFFKKVKKDTPLYWGLVIGKEVVDAALWTVVDEEVEVVGKAQGFGWQEQDADSLIDASDSALTSAFSECSEEVKEPDKVVFGLLSSWIENGDIKKDKLSLLKKLSKELELKPAGFVVTPEAIVHLLKMQEGVPINAILVGIYESELNVALVESGKIIGITDVARSISPGSDIAEGLARFPSRLHYPTRILLYNHKEGQLEDVRQAIIDTSWQEHSISFLHTPKVELLPPDIAINAVALAGGTEVGGAKSLAVADSVLPERKKEAKENMVRQIKEGESAPELPEGGNVKQVPPEELGFISGDVQDVLPPDDESKTDTEVGTDYSYEQTQQSGTGRLRFLAFWPPKFNLSNIVSHFKVRLPFPSVFILKRRLFTLSLVLSLLLLVGGGLIYWFLPKASIVIYVAPRKIEKNLVFTLDTNLNSVDKENKIVPGRIVKITVDGEKSIPTSGTKLIGEKAKGEVTIYRIGPAVVLPVGTVLTSPKGLQFTLDSEVEVASGSSPTNLGVSSPVSVTASNIGTEYNLAAGTEFTVGNFSRESTIAKNEKEFSGGTSREVSAVAKKDLEELEKELSDELVKQAKEKAKKQLGEDDLLAKDSVNFQIKEKKFTNKVGEEAETVGLKLSGEVDLLAVSLSDLRSLILEEIKDEIPADYTIPEDKMNIEVASQDSKLSVNTSVDLLPKIDPSVIKKNVAGKTLPVAQDYLASIPGFERAEVALDFKPPFLPGLPYRRENISVEIVGRKR